MGQKKQEVMHGPGAEFGGSPNDAPLQYSISNIALGASSPQCPADARPAGNRTLAVVEDLRFADENGKDRSEIPPRQIMAEDQQRSTGWIAIWVRHKHPYVVQLPSEVATRPEVQVAVAYEWQDSRLRQHRYPTALVYLNRHPTTLADRYQLSVWVSAGVAHLHTLNIIHGDIRSGQILVTDDGIPQLMPSLQCTSEVNNTEGAGTGTLPWAAPELFGDTPSHTLASDVYSLGMEIITQATPYPNLSDSSHLLDSILEGGLPSRPTECIPNNNAGNVIWDLLCRCWSRNPADRPSTAEVYDTLSKLNYQALENVTHELVVTPTTTIQELVAHFEKRGETNLTDLLQNAQFVATSPYSDTSLANVYTCDLLGLSLVAVKCVKHANPYKMRKRAARELSCWSSHKHDYILPLSGFAVVQGNLAMISPWMKNGYVTEYVVRNPDCNRLKLCNQLAQAVAYLHEQCVVHGDIKGPNVLISDLETVQIADFGVSIMDHKEIEFSVTSTGRGTQRWQAPEILDDEKDSTREGDVYALGMTMVEIYTGEPPYGPGHLSHSRISQIVSGKLRPPYPGRLRTNSYGHVVWELMERCWAGDPNQRPTSANVLEQLSPSLHHY